MPDRLVARLAAELDAVAPRRRRTHRPRRPRPRPRPPGARNASTTPATATAAGPRSGPAPARAAALGMSPRLPTPRPPGVNRTAWELGLSQTSAQVRPPAREANTIGPEALAAREPLSFLD